MPRPAPPIAARHRPASAVTESRLVLGLIAATLFLSSLPYLLGYFITPPGTVFIGTAYNIDDFCNYLSWLRQTADGHFFFRNLFTTDPQPGREFSVFFWLLGRVAHLAHLSPQAALQIARVGGGAALLTLIYRLYRFCLPRNAHARCAAFGFACLGSGFGWTAWAHWHDKNPPGSPVDAWQPEAYTFLSLYTSALMTVSTCLIVGALYALLLGEQTGRWRYPVIAGLCGAVLGNMHSYDVLHLTAAWGLYLVVWTVIKRGRNVAPTWLRSVLAFALTLPTTLYQYVLLLHDPVFRQRAAVPTLSPPVWHYLLGYGLVFLLALLAAAATRKQADPARLFPLCWAVAGLAVIYLPFAFQRKMLMGEHVPLCLLAGVGAATLTRRLSAPRQVLALALLVLAAAPSNLLFLDRDITHLEANRSETTQFPYISATLVDACRHIDTDTPPDASLVGLPTLCAYLPGLTGRAVWAGHWGETPHYADKFAQYVRACDSRTPAAARLTFLRSTRAQYLLYPNDVSLGYVTRTGQSHRFADLAHRPPAYLRPVYANKDYTLFHITAP